MLTTSSGKAILSLRVARKADIDKKAVEAILDELVHRRGVGCDHREAAGKALEKRQAETFEFRREDQDFSFVV